MTTYTASSFQCVEAEDFAYTAQGSSTTWAVSTAIAGYSGTGHLSSSGTSTTGSSAASGIAFLQNYTAPGVASSVWIRIGGNGSILVDYANDNNFETITIGGGFAWIKAVNPLASQTQIQLIAQDPGVFVDKVIITQAVETPTDADGFTNTDTSTNTGTGTTTGTTVSTEECYGTATVSCFRQYEAESAFWLENGGAGNFTIEVGSLDASGASFIQSPSMAGVLLSAAPVAHIAIAATITSNWRLWVRAKGQGQIVHTNADTDGNAVSISLNNTAQWDWYLSPLLVDPNASKIKLATLAADMQIDSFVMIDSDEIPSDIYGFCLDNGEDPNTDPVDPTTDDGDVSDINSDQHLWLPENLECRINVIPHELTNR